MLLEKISIKSSLLTNNYKQLINEVANIYGSQSIVACIDIKKNFFGNYYIVSNNLKIKYNIDIKGFIQSLVNVGIGEILVQFVDNDGLMSGQDLNFIKSIASSIPVPLITLGGIGSEMNIRMSIKAGADAVAAGSFFVYNGPHNAVLISYKNFLN